MDRVVSHVRRVGLAAVAMLSVAVGVGTIWVVANPEVIGRIPTWILLGVLGLMVLPAAAVGALVVDRRAILAERPRSRASAAACGGFIGAAEPHLLSQADAIAGPEADGETLECAVRGIAHDGSQGRGSDWLRHRHHRALALGQD